jgi:type I site-specific restriction endonuclease
MSKNDLSERDICTKYITPAVKRAGWDEMTQMREEQLYQGQDHRSRQTGYTRQSQACRLHPLLQAEYSHCNH